MQNWDTATMQQTSANSNNFLEHNTWYNQMFAANIKQEPGTVVSPPQHSPMNTASHLENYLKQHHQQFAANNDVSATQHTAAAMTPSPTNNSEFFEASNSNNNNMQLLQQQQYQQHFQQAQQAAAQNQISSHLPLGFNPLTPPGLPNAVLPAMSHYYTQATQQRHHQQTPSPCLNENLEKSALTPRHTPPMDITPPKSPKSSNNQNSAASVNQQNGSAMLVDHQQSHEDQDLISNSSEDLKYIVESEDDESIRMPIYNSHGKMKNHKCKSCGMVAITKMAFWEHARTHMKPEKILQCPKCPFVTELKHHLEYHIRKHKNLKPFQCDKCSYSCVNKSMLNSHRKSHSSVYQYRCADCDYATKYCHSFKLHLRKYEHKPGMVLDEEGIPNPSVIIDVYGTRRGPKNKSSSGAAGLKKACSDLKIPPTSQLSAALQGFPMQAGQNTSASSLISNQMPASPAKSNSSVVSDLPALTLNMSLQQQARLPQQSPSSVSTENQQQASNNQQQQQQQQINNLLPPLASLLQQNRNMAFFPYWNLNLQMLAAQQQAAVLAQLSPRMREQLQQKQGEMAGEFNQDPEDLHEDEEAEDEEEQEEFDRKSVDSAMDLSQGTPTKEEQQTPDMAMNLKLAEDHGDTPLFSSSAAVRRKGRVLKLDQEQMKNHSQLQSNSVPSSPQHPAEMPRTTSSPIHTNGMAVGSQAKLDDPSSADESMETGNQTSHSHNPTANAANTSASSTASSSGNSSNSSSTSASNSSSSAVTSPANTTMYECKYCDIFFKDAVLYTIHMGYHSCDDVFKCNMCGEKCDGPVGLFVHMARNAHS
ncbi:zinc finger protein hunchback [Haematobia irritans]|uniref:zinc finger protein hunchback n=1 Tax=Haematobia irritans TaxID=7368 RepID=UPI003F4F4680